MDYEHVTRRTYKNNKLVSTETFFRKKEIKVKIADDPNYIRHDIKCPCCGITVKQKV